MRWQCVCFALVLLLSMRASAQEDSGGQPGKAGTPFGGTTKPIDKAPGPMPVAPMSGMSPGGSMPTKDDKKELTREELLREALKHNPDIRLAEARLREAEAQLNKVRLETMQKVIMAHGNVQAARAQFEEANERYQTAQRLAKSRVISREEINSAKATMMTYKAKLALAEAELPLLIGRQPKEIELNARDRTGTMFYNVDMLIRSKEVAMERAFDYLSRTQLSELPPPKNADKLRAMLNQPVKVHFEDAFPEIILEYLVDQAVTGNLTVSSPLPFRERKVTLRFKEKVPLAAVFQWFEDNFDVRFVIREYGIVVAPRDNVPPGALSAIDFWKSKAK